VNADNATVSATVANISDTLYAPTLISPANSSATNSARVTFNWRRPSPLPVTNTIDHYDLYIDDVVFAASVPDSLTTQDFYFYTATGSSGLFFIGLKQDLTQGYHTWKVAVYDNTGQNTATGNWTFYIDSIAPFITLTSIDSTTYNWSTGGTIPAESSRYLSVDNANPTLKGLVETNSNLLITLTCPSPVPTGCTTQTTTINSTDGNWSKQFTGLVANLYYTVSLAATDAGGNSTTFPNFYIKYATTATTPTSSLTTTPTTTTSTTPTSKLTSTITPTDSITPTSTQTIPQITGLLTPPPNLAGLITPTSFVPKVPPVPTPPPQKTTKPRIAYAYGPIILILFLLLGLPTHLTLSSIGVSANFKTVLRFIFTLGFPFLKRKNTSTLPFTFIEIYDSQKPHKHPYKTISDVNGNIYFPENLPLQVLIKTKNTNYTLNDFVYPSLLLPHTCLIPLPKRSKGASESLKNNLYNLRTAPLIIAILTSAIGLYFYTNLYVITYLYLSLQYAFSEYYYPRIK
jgi:hypothetical protein